MGCDNVLEFEVVIPSGEILIVNNDSYPDLFWSLRGGGGSAFGIVTKTIMKTYPKPTLYGVNLDISASGTRDQLLDAMAYFWAMTPNMTDFGLVGYPTIQHLSPYPGTLWAPGKSPQEIEAFWAPIAAKMTQLGAKVTAKATEKELDQFLHPITNLINLIPLPIGSSMASRLIARNALNEKNIRAIRTMLDKILAFNNMILPYPVAGGQVAANRNLDIGLNPAWRDAVMHMIVIGTDPKTAIAAMDPLSVSHGAYISEASPTEADWKTTFFGPPAHYAKLLAVKKKYDPKNTLWCSPCVGSDLLAEHADGKLYHELEST
jgi:FAD/FMN-containing dehydrogenase